MSGVPTSAFEVVGFDGTATIECGRSLPVARHRAEDYFIRLAEAGEVVLPTYRFSRTEIEAFADEGRLTLLTHPLSAHAGGVVVFVTRSLLDLLNAEFPARLPGGVEVWAPAERGAVWAASVPMTTAAQMLDGWGRTLAAHALKHLTRFARLRDENVLAEAQEAVDAGLAAAIDPELRSQLYDRAGLVHLLANEPEELLDSYSLFVSREHENLSLDEYRSRLRKLAELVWDRAKIPESDLEQMFGPSGASPAEIVAPSDRRLQELAAALAQSSTFVRLDPAEYEWLKRLPLYETHYAAALEHRQRGEVTERRLDPFRLRLNDASKKEIAKDPLARAVMQPAGALN